MFGHLAFGRIVYFKSVGGRHGGRLALWVKCLYAVSGARVSVSELDDGFLKGNHYVSLYNGFLTFQAVDVGAVVRTRSTSPCLYGFTQSQRASIINTLSVRRTLLDVSQHTCARDCGLDQDCQVYYWHFDKRVGSLKNPCYLFDRELLKSWSTTFESTLTADASTRQYLTDHL